MSIVYLHNLNKGDILLSPQKSDPGFCGPNKSEMPTPDASSGWGWCDNFCQASHPSAARTTALQEVRLSTLTDAQCKVGQSLISRNLIIREFSLITNYNITQVVMVAHSTRTESGSGTTLPWNYLPKGCKCDYSSGCRA